MLSEAETETVGNRSDITFPEDYAEDCALETLITFQYGRTKRKFETLKNLHI